MSALMLGPRHEGRPATWSMLSTARWESGYHYELIDGRLAVSPAQEACDNILENWVRRKLDVYEERNPGVIQFVSCKASVFVPDWPRETVLRPDLAIYREFPLDRVFDDLHWWDVCPVLVIDVLSPDDPSRELVRNQSWWLRVPDVREYWVIDPRRSYQRPSLHRFIASRPRGTEGVPSWKGCFADPASEPDTPVVRTPVLPGFEIRLDLRS